MTHEDCLEIMREVVSRRLSKDITTQEMIQILLQKYGFSAEQELIEWFKISEFPFYPYFGRKYYKRIRESMRLEADGECIDKLYRDKYELYTPEQYIKMYLKEGKDLITSIDLSMRLFLANVRGLRKMSFSLKLRRRLG